MRLSILALFQSVADRALAWSASFTVNLIQQRLRLQTAELQREQLAEAARSTRTATPRSPSNSAKRLSPWALNLALALTHLLLN